MTAANKGPNQGRLFLEQRGAYGTALLEVLRRVESQFRGYNPAALPITMTIAGGAALYLLTDERVSMDIDATFSRRVLFDRDIEVAYRDPDGRAALLYLDRNYNDTLGLMHEDAHRDALKMEIAGIDDAILAIRVLTPLDLAVSKLARFSDQDREDILLLARRKLIDAASLRARAEDALKAYVGNIAPVRNTIEIACRLIESFNPGKKSPGKV
ncbi:MAG: DUF6036 family nucleotidyltransferase [Betaproteobacteria bacterium]|nr:DUF6036 family nucleotidyltransferase [Betaproteobacteria bacterium]MDH4292697.1 DUF6036 family nucleotidyltransferase [Betaproteobacteria bacterium]